MSDMRQMTPLGRSIEDGSFAIIDQEAGPHDFSPAQWQVVRRVIHATADFEFMSLMRFGGVDAIAAGVRALRAGCPLLVDVRIIAAGLNEERLRAYGCAVHSYISDPDVIATASANTTRAIESMRKAHRLGTLDGAVVAIGNAPTALLEIVRLVREEGARPALVIAVPVGFVSAAESKEAILDVDVPAIVARGRKGGSPIAVAIIHALLLLSTEGEGSA